ncbi:MAG TPA: FecR domain-containing protein [Caulobacteraceae bacterium]
MSRLRNEIASDTRKDVAVDWFLRRSAGPLSGTEAEAFEAWLAQSPENERVYAALDLAWSAAGEAEDHPVVSARNRVLVKAVDRARATRRAVLATLAVAVIGGAGAAWQGLTAPKPLVTQSFSTAVGQQATVTLPDGSRLTLNTDTVVRTKADADRRLVYLEKGQAYFQVAKDRRHPFIVTAAGRTVTALGTAFDVRVDQGGLKVVLVEGKVRVESAPSGPFPRRQTEAVPAAPVQATEMTAGSQLIAPDDAEWRLARADVDRETSWLRGQITFDDAPLGVIVAELNRYSTRKIVLADEQLASVRLGGIYTPGDVDGFSRALRAYGVAEVAPGPEGELRVVALK